MAGEKRRENEPPASAAAPAAATAPVVGRVGESVLQRMGHAVAPACASVVTVVGIGFLGVLAAGPEAIGPAGRYLKSLNALTVGLLVAAAEGLWLLVDRKPRPGKRIAAYTLATVVLGAALLHLLVVFGVVAPDRLEAWVPAARTVVWPLFFGMTPDAGLCLALLALGLLTVDLWPALRYPPSQVFALVLGLLALFSFVAYGYGLIAIVRIGPNQWMNLPTSAAFLALAVGLLFARPGRGFARIILSDTAGGESARWLLPVAVLVPVLLGATRLEGERLGWFTAGAGTVLLVMALILLQLAMIWWNSALLYRTDMQRESIRERLRHDSLHDALTGLANRANFLQRLERAAHRAKLYEVPCAVLYMDLDGFKQVNDTLGHPAGDTLLQAVAARLARSVRIPQDLCARLGGDEFVVVLEDSERARAYEVATRILEAVSQPYGIEEKEVRVGVSIGVALAGKGTPSAESLLKAADVALYTAKHDGKGRIHPSALATA